MHVRRPSRGEVEKFVSDYWDSGATTLAGIALPYFFATDSSVFDLKDIGMITATVIGTLGFRRAIQSKDPDRIMRDFYTFFSWILFVLPSNNYSYTESARTTSYAMSTLTGINSFYFDWQRRRNSYSLEQRVAEE